MRGLLALLLLVGPVACGGSTSGDGDITVFAAASLTEAFTELGTRFEAGRAGTKVTFSFGASSTLVDQVRHGAPADVVATADEASMQPLVAARLVEGVRVFARNRLAVVVRKGNPKGVRGLGDLGRHDVAVVLCAAEVPCGRLAAQAFERAGVKAAPRSYEANVRAVLSKVSLGEADAGVVYVTDLRVTDGAVEGVDIPAEHNVATAYPIARVGATRKGRTADAFVDFVASDEGRRVLAGFGFDP